MYNTTPTTSVLFPRCLKQVLLGVVFASVLLASLLATVISHPTSVNAATQSTINFQARLQDGTGAIVPDGYYNVQFKLYDASTAGTNLWTETYYDANGVTAGQDNRIRVQNGYLSVALGSQTAFPATINWDRQLWLTMNIGGITQTATPTYDGEMNPRLALTAVPYAFRAGQLAQQTGSYESTLGFTTQTGNRNILLPDESGTLCIQNSANCGFLTGASANGSYVQLQATGPGTQQTGNLNISGAGILGGGLTVGSTVTLQNGATIVNSTSNLLALSSNSRTLSVDFADSSGYVTLGTSGSGPLRIKTGIQAIGSVTARSSGGDSITLNQNGTSNGSLSNTNGPININPSNGLVGVTGSVDVSGSYKINGTDICTASGCTPAAGSGNYIQNGTSPQTANFNIVSAAAGSVAAVIKGTTGQTADILQVQNNAGNGFVLNAQGNLVTSGGLQVLGNLPSTSSLYVKSSQASLGSGFFLGANNSTANVLTVAGGFGASTGDIFVAKTFSTEVFNVHADGSVLFKNAANSATAFQIQNASGATMFNVDTTSGAATFNGAVSGITTLTTSGNITTTSGALNVQGSGSNYFAGNVGVGGADANYKLNVYSGTGYGLRLLTDNQSPYALVINNATYGSTVGAGLAIWQADNGTANINLNGGTRLAIAASGNVGIGTGGPGYKLDVNGDVNIASSSAYKIGGTNICTASGCTPAAGSANYIQNTATLQTSANLAIQSAADASTTALFQGRSTQSATTLLIKQGASQSGNALQVVDSTNALQFKIDQYGGLEQVASANFDSYVGIGSTGNATSGISLNVANSSGTRVGLQVLGNYNQTADVADINSGNSGGTLTNTLSVNRDLSGGTTTNAINIQRTAGTLTNGLSFTGTIGTDINRSSGTLSINGAGGINLNSNGTTTASLSSTGAALFKNTSNSTSAFQIQNAAGSTVWSVDTTNARVLVGGGSTSYFPKLYFGDPGATLNNAWIGEFGATDSDRLQLQGRTGINLTTGNSAATVFKLDSTGNATFQNSTDGTAAFQILNTSSTPILNVDTLNSRLGVGTAAPATLFHEATSSTSTTLPMARLEQTSTGDATVEFKNTSASFYLGQDTSNGNAFTINSYTAATQASPDSVMGYTTGTVSFNDNNGSSWVMATQVTASTSGTISSLWTKIASVAASPNNHIMMALYADTGANHPGTRLGSSPSTVAVANNWNEGTLTASVNVIAGTKYWIAFSVDSASTTYPINTTAGLGSTQSNNTYGSFPSTFVETQGQLTDFYFVYANVIGASGAFTDTFTNPIFQLSQSGSLTLENSSNSSSAFAVNNAAGASLLTVNTTTGGVTIGAPAANYTQRLCHNQSNGATSNMTLGDCAASGQADLAEFYDTTGVVEPGDIVAPSVQGQYKLQASDRRYQANAIGIVSTNPTADGIIGNNVTAAGRQPVALAGRVPLKVSLENGPIAIGDPLAAGSLPGTAMKATDAGQIIGYALENYDGSSPAVSDLVKAEEADRAQAHASDLSAYYSDASKWPAGVGKIMAFAKAGYNNPLASVTTLQGSQSTSEDVGALGARVDGLETQLHSVAANLVNLQATVNGFGASLNTGSLQADSLKVTGDAAIQGNLTVGGLTKLSTLQLGGHFITGGERPTIETQPYAGITPQTDDPNHPSEHLAKAEVKGNDTGGKLTLTVGDPLASIQPGDVVKVKFNKSFEIEPQVLISARGKDGAQMQFYVDDVTKDYFTVAALGTPLAGTTYTITYYVFQ